MPYDMQSLISELSAARTKGRRIRVDELSPDLIPASPDEGYKAQHALLAHLGQPVGGWKIGATAPPTMTRFGLDEPFYGAVLAADLHASGDHIPENRYPAKVLETEFAYRMARDVPVGSQPPTKEDLLDAVEALVPVFEIINPRFDRIPFEKVPLAIADLGLNGGLVLGKPIKNWRNLDLSNHPVRLVVDGEIKGEGSSADAMGHPAESMTWFARKLWHSGEGLKKGQYISTGSCTGVVPIEANKTAVGDFGPLGRIELRFV
ncbi:MAG: 2-keto-4-pentenoate hydratase [Hyphomicrobiaceae bacterium]